MVAGPGTSVGDDAGGGVVVPPFVGVVGSTALGVPGVDSGELDVPPVTGVSVSEPPPLSLQASAKRKAVRQSGERRARCMGAL